MDKLQIDRLCKDKERELLDKHFSNLTQEAFAEHPETIGDYTPELPHQIEAEYAAWIKKLWKQIAPNSSKSIDEMLDRPNTSQAMTGEKRENIRRAYDEATHLSLWERITKSNHKDVTKYKHLLMEYTKDLLLCLRCDFIEDLKSI